MFPALIRVISKMFHRPRAKLRLLGRLAKVSHKVAPLPNPGFIKVFRHALRLYLEKAYLPEEAFKRGIMDPDYPEEKLRDFVSRRKMSQIQKALNPDSWVMLCEDKSMFYRYCVALKIPIPEFYACFYKEKAGWSHTGAVLKNREDWTGFLDNNLPEEFVIKPAWGVYGSGLRVLHRSTTGVFTDASGLQQDAADVYDAMLLYPGYDSFVIQERLRNHPELVRLSNTEYLQTLRVVTYIDSSSACNILYAFFKPIVGSNFSDNHAHGVAGNLVARVDLEKGTLRSATIMTIDGSGDQTVPRHPTTGLPFEGFQLPMWKESCQLVTETARNFLPLRTVGWDIAITPNGPFIIEGNPWADPFYFDGAADILAPLFRQD